MVIQIVTKLIVNKNGKHSSPTRFQRVKIKAHRGAFRIPSISKQTSVNTSVILSRRQLD